MEDGEVFPLHTMWKGAISFGMVNIPVRMFAATEDKDVHLTMLHQACHTPIRYQRHCPHCLRAVPPEEIVKGYEIQPGRYVVLDDDDLARLAPERSKNIEILDFVRLEEIDPIYFVKSYYLSPQETGRKAYALLREAMERTGKIAVAQVMLRNKNSLAALRVYRNVLVLETILYPDEVRAAEQVPGVPDKENVQEKELQLAIQLVEQLTAPFEPEKYADDYRNALLAFIEQKQEGAVAVSPAPAPPSAQVIDLMEALKASLEAAGKK
ncbi:MAG: Ku protein, partial [Bacillaceae bacterium G1]